MTDEHLDKALRGIDNLNQGVVILINAIEESDHPDAEEVAKALREKHFGVDAYATDCWSPT